MAIGRILRAALPRLTATQWAVMIATAAAAAALLLELLAFVPA